MPGTLPIDIAGQILHDLQDKLLSFYWTLLLQYKSEKDGVIETRIENRVVVSGNVADFDHDKSMNHTCFSVA
jgi:4.1 protein C-terminal domain (CTD)